MKHALLLASTCLFGIKAIAQDAYRLRLDTSALNSFSPGPTLPMSDGGSTLQLSEPFGFSLWRCDASGVPLWRNRYPSVATYDHGEVARANNGDLLIAYANWAETTWDQPVMLGWDLWRVAPDGSPLWHKDIHLDTLYGLDYFVQHIVHVVESPQGDIHVLSCVDLSTRQMVAVTKVDAAGNFLWSTWVGDPMSEMTFPTPQSTSDRFCLSPTPDGGCTFTTPASYNTGEGVYIVHLSASGSLAWAREYDYLGVADQYSLGRSTVDPDGNTLIRTSTNSTNGGTHVVRISPTGELLSVYTYELLFFGNFINDEGIIYLEEGGTLKRLAPSGALIAGFNQLPLAQTADSTYTLWWSDPRIKQARICLRAEYRATPVGAGLPIASPGLVSFNLSEETSCAHSTFTSIYPPDTLPNSIFSCVPLEPLAAVQITPQIGDAPLDFIARPLLNSVDLCVLTSITPLAEAPMTFTVNRTLLLAGDPLTVTSERPLRYSIVDMKGALVWNELRASQRLDIPTLELTPGLYMLMGRDVTGQVVGTAKVVVE